MKRRPLGKTGRTVSAIGLGCMGMSEFYGPTDEAQSLDAMAAALDLGIDFFDTADMYGIGDNEKLVGRFLKGKRDKIRPRDQIRQCAHAGLASPCASTTRPPISRAPAMRR